MAVADFSVNYFAVIQDEIQSYHWNSTQTTIHPFVCYYGGGGGGGKYGVIANTCFVVISESTEHNTTAVHLFQRKLINFLIVQGGERLHVVFFSDGCAAQYQNIINLCHHKDDFGVEVKWNFFATSHGKTAGNGAAGTLKRSASRASL